MSARARADGSFLQSLSIQSRVVGALLMREIITRYGRHNIGFLWLFVEPMMFTLAVTLLWSGLGLNHTSTLPITAFAVTGYSSILLWRNMPGRLIASVTPNLALMYHRNVKVVDVFAARLILEFVGATISFIVLAIGFAAYGWMDLPEDLLKVMGGWLLIAWFGAGLALVLGSLSEDYELVEKLWHPAAYMIMPLSGAGFVVSSLPQAMQEVVLYIPVIHATEYLREGYFGSLMDARYDLGYVIGCNLVLTLLGIARMTKVSREVQPE
ncbi:ABC transporter permease [Sphingobium sp. CFD-2]|uniref:ABC transporter permease n=1 Tax=Sphingobium sp. CFD-2 TaxID=2878542 RepID=UPI00214C5B46|nr:ABC transporter permease [Sphingobium sp. CFD-2]